MEDIRNKPGFCRFLEEDIFERYVILGNKAGPGTVLDICDGRGRSLYVAENVGTDTGDSFLSGIGAEAVHRLRERLRAP